MKALITNTFLISTVSAAQITHDDLHGSKPPQIMALVYPHNGKGGMWQYEVQKQCTQGFGGKT
jgi:hypothetical protein